MRLVVALAAALALAACGTEGCPPPPAVPEWAMVSPEQIAAAKEAGVSVAAENSIGMRFVLIPPGKFTMGSPLGQQDCQPNETAHEVELTTSFYISIYETTNEDYRRFRALHDSGRYVGEEMNTGTQPVVGVDAEGALAFAAWLGRKEPGMAYRLPTEAEWEYACRAGTKTSRWWGDAVEGAKGRANVYDLVSKQQFDLSDDSFDFDDRYRVAAPVGRLAANPWGLYDMLGNVGEWCSDWYDEYPEGPVRDPRGPAHRKVYGRIMRGGSWLGGPREIRSAFRQFTPPLYGCGGFRLVLEVPRK